MGDAVNPPREPRFVSLQWRFILPLFVVILVVAMGGAYLLANNVGGNMQLSQENLLLQSSRTISERAAALYQQQRQEAQLVAFTIGVAEAARDGNAVTLEKRLTAPARLAQLDSVIVTDAGGVEILGLLRTGSQGRGEYAVSTGTDLSAQPVVRGVLDDAYIGATGLLRTAENTLLYTAVPISIDETTVGVALVGQRLESVLAHLRGSTIIDVAFYGPDGALARTTFPLTDDTLAALQLTPEAFNHAVASAQPVQPLTISSQSYKTTAFPFQFGPNVLGVMAAFAPDALPALAHMGRQITGLVMALIAGAVVIVVFTGVNMMVVSRVNRVTNVANELLSGQAFARTQMQPTDEIGALGQALDRYADYVQERQDELRASLRRQRRETEHLTAVLQSLPDGVIVQDNDGRVLLMNELARKLLGSHRVFRSSGLADLTAAVTDVLGASLAPGIYMLGDPRRVELDDKMISAQAAAVLDLSGERVGTVIVLRDITSEVRLERARDALLNRFTQAVQQPMAEMARAEGNRQPQAALPRELARHAVTLQKLIAEMRDLSGVDAPGIREGQRPLLLDTLIWTVANEWRQIAQAANLTLDVQIERKGLYVLGDERRLRWAVGNLVDNAIKFTPPGGKISLDIRGESNGYALLRVRDNGVGITPDELPHVFTRFYRGSPVTPAGRAIHVPGMGQGLTVARQIVEGHGGRIELRSKPGQGTAVFLALPLTASVSLELPQMQVDMEGETVQIRHAHELLGGH
ncbi:MAG: PAS domain-containing protein [Chloroflexi bacterium]|nr:PAS domain-containing protein [Chloroflexota bacterium]